MLRSPIAVTSALRMARDEMEVIKDLDTPLLTKYSDKIYFYYALKDDWVGQEKGAVIATLGGSSERITEDPTDTPHAFVITKRHSRRVAEQCSLWLQESELVKKKSQS
ncbi:hypothetical protein FRB90_008805 [Tulasnella sp. 427]|nr:hypothetical protein FRB90_008805 [Tulasnella sp. 427]